MKRAIAKHPNNVKMTAKIIKQIAEGSKENTGINDLDNKVKMGENSSMMNVFLPINENRVSTFGGSIL